MIFHCIADEDTVRGFRLAGVQGDAARDAAAAEEALVRAMARPEVGIVILTESLADALRARVDALRFERDRPLIVEIPGPEGARPGRHGLRQWVRAAIGMAIEPEADAGRRPAGSGNGIREHREP